MTASEYIGGFVSHSFMLRNASRAVLSLPTKSAYVGQRPRDRKKTQDLKNLEIYLPQERNIKVHYTHGDVCNVTGFSPDI